MTPALLHPFAPPAREQFVRIVRGEGALVWDESGREYVDGLASLWYCAVGHGRVELARAAADQMATLAAYSTFDPFSNPVAEALAERIVALGPLPRGRVFFTSSGSEAVDTGTKLVRQHFARRGEAQRHRIIARSHSYHGVNYGGTSVQALPLNREGWGELLSGVHHVPHHDLAAVETIFEQHPGEVAAVFAEPVQGAGGVFPPRPGYLDGLRKLCDLHGALLVFDEVITGFGRLGTWFGATHYGVVPDLILFAKAVTSGYLPLGGVLLSRAVADQLESDPTFILRHGYTYSGHPTCAAVALANLSVIERESLLTRAGPLGIRLRDGLQKLASDGFVSEVRGDGGVWACDLVAPFVAPKIRDAMLSRGAITRALGPSTLAFCPPLVATPAQVDRLLEALEGSLREAARSA